MRWINILFISLFTSICLISCIEPFQPETSDYEAMLLIEGLICDNPAAPPKVSISRTVPLNENVDLRTIFESGAIVTIICDDGMQYPLAEASLGTYINTGDWIELEEDKYYKLRVLTKDGETFESDFEPYIQSPPIDSITYKTDVKKVNEAELGDQGLQFYIHSSGLDEKPFYLRWMLDATYNYYAEYESKYRWMNKILVPFINSDIRNCWKDISIDGVFIGSSENLTENRISDAPLNFVSQYGDELTSKYSLHVIQLSISESIYKFWQNLDNIINETGGLYETQPYRIKGNIYCTSNPDINVLGIFEVAGTMEERIFVPKPRDFIVYDKVCTADTVPRLDFGFGDLPHGSYISSPAPGIYFTSESDCFNCLERGGYTERPLFWE